LTLTLTTTTPQPRIRPLSPTSIKLSLVSSLPHCVFYSAFSTNLCAIPTAIQVVLHIRSCDARLPPGGGGKVGPGGVAVKALKAGQEAYWLDQIARNRDEYFSGRGESPGRFVGRAAATAGLEGIASAEILGRKVVHYMAKHYFQPLD
jgi:hypothetical protein